MQNSAFRKKSRRKKPNHFLTFIFGRLFTIWKFLFSECISATNFWTPFVTSSKDKSPKVPFRHTAILKNWNFCANSARSKTWLWKKNRNKKFVDKAQQCFAFFHIKPKFILLVVQWSGFLERYLVNLSHLYFQNVRFFFFEPPDWVFLLFQFVKKIWYWILNLRLCFDQTPLTLTEKVWAANFYVHDLTH